MKMLSLDYTNKIHKFHKDMLLSTEASYLELSL
jgi:hypothetical protein